MPQTQTKPLPTLVSELWDLVVAYVRQETVEPLRGLGRFVAYGLVGAALTGTGAVFLLLAALRALQEETGDTFAGNWSWAPYAITLVGAAVVVGLAVSRVGRGRRR
ncbi:MAG: hypothetical protein C4344_05350 [Acidimicrobiia bacterium]